MYPRHYTPPMGRESQLPQSSQSRSLWRRCRDDQGLSPACWKLSKGGGLAWSHGKFKHWCTFLQVHPFTGCCWGIVG